MLTGFFVFLTLVESGGLFFGSVCGYIPPQIAVYTPYSRQMPLKVDIYCL